MRLMKYYDMPVHVALKTRRLDLEMTQRELARAIGFNGVNFVSMMEAGNSKIPYERASDLARVLALDPVLLVAQMVRSYNPEIARELFHENALTHLLEHTTAKRDGPAAN